MTIHRRILCKQSRLIKPMYSTLLNQTVVAMHRASFALVAKVDNIGESYRISDLKAFVLGCWIDGFDVACTFVANCYGFLVVHGHGHEVGVA